MASPGRVCLVSLGSEASWQGSRLVWRVGTVQLRPPSGSGMFLGLSGLCRYAGPCPGGLACVTEHFLSGKTPLPNARCLSPFFAPMLWLVPAQGLRLWPVCSILLCQGRCPGGRPCGLTEREWGEARADPEEEAGVGPLSRSCCPVGREPSVGPRESAFSRLCPPIPHLQDLTGNLILV